MNGKPVVMNPKNVLFNVCINRCMRFWCLGLMSCQLIVKVSWPTEVPVLIPYQTIKLRRFNLMCVGEGFPYIGKHGVLGSRKGTTGRSVTSNVSSFTGGWGSFPWVKSVILGGAGFRLFSLFVVSLFCVSDLLKWKNSGLFINFLIC